MSEFIVDYTYSFSVNMSHIRLSMDAVLVHGDNDVGMHLQHYIPYIYQCFVISYFSLNRKDILAKMHVLNLNL